MASGHARARTDTHICPNCKKQIQPGERLILNLISLGKSPYDLSGQTLELGMDFEYIHIDCKNPGLYPIPKPKASPDDLSPHVPAHQDKCTRCRRPFKEKDVIVPVFISQGKAYDPLDPVIPGLNIVNQFELMHANCRDPQLLKVTDAPKKEAAFPGDIRSFQRTQTSAGGFTRRKTNGRNS